MEMLCDSEHERLVKIRKMVKTYDNMDGLSPSLMVQMDNLRFLLRYIGELETELWSRDH